MDSFNIYNPSPYPGNPFDPANDMAFAQWRAWKLAEYPTEPAELMVEVKDAARLSNEERGQITRRLLKTNLAIYRITEGDIQGKDTIRRLGRQLGLEHLDDNLCADQDSITSLQVVDAGRHTGYIPYSNKPLNWHTDGYYNPLEYQIRAILMHCVRPALEGGENALLDHELIYIKLRDENPDFIRALMAPDAMTIPPNNENDTEIRGAQSGPVFSIEKGSGNLHMRYSARMRNIIWKEDAITREAEAYLRDLLTAGTNGVFEYRLQAGEGLISNNVLHRRAGFSDGEQQASQRLLYRARFYDRVKGTDLADIPALETR